MLLQVFETYRCINMCVNVYLSLKSYTIFYHTVTFKTVNVVGYKFVNRTN